MNKVNYEKICKELNINLIWDKESCNKDGGASSPNTIILYPCSKKWIEELSFWHELGHILLIRTMTERNQYLSTLSCEGAAWELGLSEASAYGRTWKYKSKEMEWARKQLASYVGGEYDELKNYYKV
jgi:galactitol-specific phosphotransferase system IIB component